MTSSFARGAGALIGLAVVAATAIAIVSYYTHDVRQRNRLVFENKALAEVLPDTSPEYLCEQILSVTRVASEGYGGIMTVAVIQQDDRVTAARVLTHNETPSFASILQPGDWIDSFSHHPPANIDAVTRATITSEAVLRAVKTAQLNPDQVLCP